MKVVILKFEEKEVLLRKSKQDSTKKLLRLGGEGNAKKFRFKHRKGIKRRHFG